MVWSHWSSFLLVPVLVPQVDPDRQDGDAACHDVLLVLGHHVPDVAQDGPVVVVVVALMTMGVVALMTLGVVVAVVLHFGFFSWELNYLRLVSWRVWEGRAFWWIVNF